MPVPFPSDDIVDLQPPGFDETVGNAAIVLSATATPVGNTVFQRLLIASTFESLTGHAIDTDALEFVDAVAAAEFMRRRAQPFRMRMVHMMVLSALVLRPIPPEVAENVAAYSRELGIDDRLLEMVEQLSASSAALAAIDFERNGYTGNWSPEQSAALHASVESGWDAVPDDPTLAAKWAALAELPAGSLGHQLHRFYLARGFAVPGSPGSAPPLLAQHDWVHVLADYGTTVDAELEVFAFIARANDDPRGFSLLAMVVSLFETGALASDAGLFEAFPGQLSRTGMTQRVGDAMRRGALSHGRDGAPDVDFMQVDWFEIAHLPVEDVRQLYNVIPKAQRAIDAGSTSPWGGGGISPTQLAMGQAFADQLGIRYDSFGATPPTD
jgi:hypothetical protein